MAKVSIKAAHHRALAEDEQLRSVATSGTHVNGVTADSFINLAHKLGVGADNALSSGTYGFNPITRNRTQLEWIHRGSWIGGLVVDLPADDMTRAGVEYITEMPPDDIEVLDRKIAALNIWPEIANVIRWGRLYGGGLGVILIDGADMKEPLTADSIGPGDFRGLLSLDRWMVEPSYSDLVEELGPHLGKPRYYRVSQNAPALRGKTIHHSRVAFRILGHELPYNQSLTEGLWGCSVLERLYDRMLAFDSASMGIAQLIFKAHLRTLAVKDLREIVSMGQNSQALMGLVSYVDNMRRYQSSEGVTMIDAEDTMHIDQMSAISGVSDALTSLGQQLSGAAQVPLVRLFGQSPAGLNSTGEADMRMYYDGIGQKQMRDLHTGTQLVYKCAAISSDIKLPHGFTLGFRSLWEMSDTEKSQVTTATSGAITGAHEAGLISDYVAMKELRQLGRKTGVFTNITEDDLGKADKEIAPPEPDLMGALGGPPPIPGMPAPKPAVPPIPGTPRVPVAKPLGVKNEPPGTPKAPVPGQGRRVQLQPQPAGSGKAGGSAGPGNVPVRQGARPRSS